MESTTNTVRTNPTRQTAIHSLAVVGFVALVIIGMTIAIYAARYVPTAVSRLASGAVYLSSVFTPAKNANQLEVVPTATTTLPIQTSTATTTVVTTTPKPVTTTTAAPAVTPSAGVPSSTTYAIGGGTVAPKTLYGLPDLAVTITAVGYLDTDSTSSFVASSSVPSGKRPAVKFAITNDGTNVSGPWSFDAQIPTSPSYTFHSGQQESMQPSDRVEYTLGFDRAKTGSNQTITITVDPSRAIVESNENNNTAGQTITVLK